MTRPKLKSEPPTCSLLRMIARLLFYGAVCMLLSTHALATEWTRIYGTPSDESGLSVVVTQDDGLLIAGVADSRMWLLKLDSTGTVAWSRRFFDATALSASVHELQNGDYVVVSQTWSHQTQGAFWVARMDQNGDLLSARLFDSTDHESAGPVVATRDGGYLVGGFSSAHGGLLIKFDSQDAVEWSMGYSGSWPRSIRELTDGYVMTGAVPTLWSFLIVPGTLEVMKVDATGAPIWRNTYDGLEDGRSIRSTVDGGYIVVGHTPFVFGSGSRDAAVLKLSATGQVTWSRLFWRRKVRFPARRRGAAGRGLLGSRFDNELRQRDIGRLAHEIERIRAHGRGSHVRRVRVRHALFDFACGSGRRGGGFEPLFRGRWRRPGCPTARLG